MDRNCRGKKPACQSILPTSEHPIVSHNRANHGVHVDAWDRGFDVLEVRRNLKTLTPFTLYCRLPAIRQCGYVLPCHLWLIFLTLTLQEVECEGGSKEEMDKTSGGDTKSWIFCCVKTQEAKAKQ